MHPREAKYKHAAQFPLKSGIENKQIPEGVLVCNMGTDLIDHDQVVTMFHEFGHLMHHILGGTTPWHYFSGVATEWDFVEAPSQLFEEWAWDHEVLVRFAEHVETGEKIPASLVNLMRTAHEWGSGLFVRRQMAFAAISLELHVTPPENTEILEQKITEISSKYGAFPHTPELHIGANFEHLIGYSALYYTYMWSLVIAKDLRSGFGKNLMDPGPAQKYVQTILMPGGSEDAVVLIKNFLGRPYLFDAFREWLAK
jgi:thimet oligopeptidase